MTDPSLQLEVINILVVDDNDHDFRIISRAFKQCNFSVNITRCKQGEAALEIIRLKKHTEPFDILLTDLLMPGISGLELAEQLLGDGVSFPIILLTGGGDEHTAVKALKLGVSDYLSKDIGASFLELLPEAVIKAIHSYSIRAELQASESRNKMLSSALEQSQSAVTIINLDRNIVYVNEQCQKISGYHSSELNNKNIFQLVASSMLSVPDLQEMWSDALKGKSTTHELKKRHKNGEFFWVTFSMTPICDDSAEIAFILIVEESIEQQRKIVRLEQDIRYRIKSEEKLRKLKEKVEKTSRQLALKIKELSFKQSALDEHAIVSITDIKGKILYANKKFSAISQYSLDELIGNDHRMIKSNHHPKEFYKNMWRTIARGDVWHGDIQNKAKDGSFYWVASTIAPMLDDNNKPQQYISIRTDITNTKKQQEMLEIMAHYDVLTQLPNRILLQDRFGQAVAHSSRTETILAVCFLDLDNFKPINDRYGHEVGDNLLIDVAQRLKDTIRKEDTASRQGGDEFILLLSDITSVEQCDALLGRIIAILRQPYLINGEKISISASVGYTLYPLDDADIDTLVRHADHAMYEAKSSGRDSFHRFNTMNDLKNIQYHSDRNEINKAYINHEFCLYYQPKVDMKTGDIFGFEALIRWQHPEKGIVSPIEFLPNINGTELEIEVSNWVINEAIRQLSIWLSQGYTFAVSVNVSSYHLLSDSFFMNLHNTFSRFPEVNSQNFQLEILESRALNSVSKINTVIKNCQDILGVSIALDDFGTGYSSLTHLRSLSTDVIKIDQSFVRRMVDDPNDYAIISGVIGLADSFNREVIAEGVENTEHGLLLINMGCKNAQGYGIARPMPAEQVVTWVRNYQPNQEWIQVASKSVSSIESRKKLLLLIINTWVRRIEERVLSPFDATLSWPILTIKNSPSYILIMKEKKNNILDSSLLNELTQLNKAMFSITNEIYTNYQAEQFEKAKDDLGPLQTLRDKVTKLL